MLHEFCATLTNEAQLKIALRLIRLALPVWKEYFAANPEKILEVDELVPAVRRLPGAYPEITVDLPEKGLREIEKAYEVARGKSDRPATIMHEHVVLTPLLHTFLGPLTNGAWDSTLPDSIRLVYTSVWNVLTWLLHHENNDEGEPHIYIAINQAADVLMREKIMTPEEINPILLEYAGQKRHADENGDGGMKYESQDRPPVTMNDAYQKIIGPVPVPDPPKRSQAAEIVRQMRGEGKSYWDEWEEYYSGTNTSYSFDKEAQKFKKVEIDVIVGSFCNTYWLSEQEIAEEIQKYSVSDLRKAGFNI